MAEPETLYEMFVTAAKRFDLPVALAARRGGTWKTYSHAELLRRVRHLALGLHELGVRKGDRVALVSESRPEWTMLDLATLGCSAALVPVYPTLTIDHIGHIVADSGAKVCVVSTREQYEKVAEMLPSLPSVERVVAFDRDGIDPSAPVMSLEELEELGAARDLSDPGLAERLAAESGPDDLATLIYTSGTTGKQKGVMLTNRNFLTNIVASFAETNLFAETDVAFSYLPLSHIFERTAVYGFLKTGIPIYFATSFEKVADEIKEVRPTVVTSVPRFFEKVYEKICVRGRAAGGLKRLVFERALRCGDAYARATHAGRAVSPLVELEYDLVANRLVFAKWREALGGRLRFFVSGGAPLSPDIAYAFLGAGIPIYEGYGLTETSPVITVNCPGKHRIGSVGRVLSNLEVRLDEDGEILVKGPSVMTGYYNLPEETAAAFTEDGFFRTGDIGAFDEDGYLRITDRKKDLIKTSGGKYVAPQPIENALKASPLVSQAVVLGDRRKFCSALIVPNFEALEAACAERGIDAGDREALVRDPRVLRLYEEAVEEQTAGLSRFEKIKRVALLPRELTIDAGEMTPTLKVRRRVVEERYKSLIDGIYAGADEREAPAHA